MKLFRRQRYVRESPHSVTLAQFRYNVANMGNKYPRVGRHSVQRDCPLCPQRERNSVAHLALFCSSIERIRKEQTTIHSEIHAFWRDSLRTTPSIFSSTDWTGMRILLSQSCTWTVAVSWPFSWSTGCLNGYLVYYRYCIMCNKLPCYPH